MTNTPFKIFLRQLIRTPSIQSWASLQFAQDQAVRFPKRDTISSLHLMKAHRENIRFFYPMPMQHLPLIASITDSAAICGTCNRYASMSWFHWEGDGIPGLYFGVFPEFISGFARRTNSEWVPLEIKVFAITLCARSDDGAHRVPVSIMTEQPWCSGPSFCRDWGKISNCFWSSLLRCRNWRKHNPHKKFLMDFIPLDDSKEPLHLKLILQWTIQSSRSYGHG
jgi:hypothetical protein